MQPVIFNHGEIQLRLRNVNFHALRRAKTRERARGRRRRNHVGRIAVAEWQARLRFFFLLRWMPARPIYFQASGNLTAPFRFFRRGGRAIRSGRGLGNHKSRLTKRTHINRLIAYRATLRADLNHRFVLRCGPESHEERKHRSRLAPPRRTEINQPVSRIR